MCAVLPIQRPMPRGRSADRLRPSILAGAFLLLPIALHAQAQQKQGPKPTTAIRKALDDAYKVRDNVQRALVLKTVLAAAKAADDLDGQGEAEIAMGVASQSAEATPWFQAAAKDFDSIHDSRQQAIALMFLGNGYLTLGQQDKALEIFNEALPRSREAGDGDTIGHILVGLGNADGALGQPQKALDSYTQALTAFKSVGDKPMVARVLGSLASGYRGVGQLRKSLDFYQQLLSSLEETHDADGVGTTLENLGVSYAAVGQNKTALDYFNKAFALLSKVGDKPSLAHTTSDIGITYANLGQQQRALDYYQQALTLEKEVGDKLSMGKTLGNIGLACSELGRLHSALDYFNQATSVFKDLGDKQSLVIALLNIGNLYGALGESQKAVDYWNQSLPIEKEIGNIHLQGLTLSNLAGFYHGKGQNSRALELYNQALAIEKTVGDRLSAGKVLDNIGAVYADLGQTAEALNQYNEALALFREFGDQALTGVALTNIGTAYDQLGQKRRALRAYNQAVSISRAVGDRTTEANTLDALAMSLKSRRQPALAIVFAKQSVNTYQDVRKGIRGLPKEDQAAYVAKVEPTYRHLADLLIKQGRLSEAEKVMNLLKDEENFEFVARGTGGGGIEGRIEAVGKEAKWWKSYEQLQNRALKIEADDFDLTQKASHLRSASELTPQQKAELAKMEADLKELDAQKDVLDNADDAYFDEVGKQASQLGDAIRKEAEERVRETGDELPLLLGRIHRDTSEKIGAVYALASADELDFLVVTYAGRAHLSVPVKSDDLNAMISGFRKSLMNPYADPKPAGEKLYHLVFENLIRQLRAAGCTRVVWCLDGTLRYVPIGALWDGSEYLIEKGDYTMFDPLNLERMAADTSKSLLAAGFAATEGKGTQFAPLPGADKELKGVVKDVSQQGFTGAVPGRAFENKRFDSASLTSAMRGEQYSLLHIATHFSIGKDFNASDLLLGDGKLLSLKDFTDAGSHGRLGHLDLVCLSACDTAESFGDSAGTGSQFSSFVSLTLKDGASSVVASLWPVSDASTPILMQRFYANWMAKKEQGKAEALRGAQLSLLHGEIGDSAGATRSAAANAPADEKPFIPDPKRPFAHPFYWAPFILFGNWK